MIPAAGRPEMAGHRFIAKIAIIWTIGIIIVVVVGILAPLGFAGHAVGGRKHYS
jgi:hypothetical protein